MPVLVILIVFALSFYAFYKVKAYRSTKPIVKQWISAKSSIALGLFVALYGLNQLFLFRSTLTFIIGIIFVIIGFSSSWAGFRAYKKYLPDVIKEEQK
jgi:YtpI-like protein